MKSIVLIAQNILSGSGIELALKKSGDFLTYQLIPSKSGNAPFECNARNAEILLVEVGGGEHSSLESRMNMIKEVKEFCEGIKVALFCDEVAYPEVAKKVMRAKQCGQIEEFYYTSVSIEYMVDSLDAL